jgi:putative hydroxymethylpyrimidine transport system permease protein
LKRSLDSLLPLALLGLLAFFWQAAVWTFKVPPYLLPGPERIARVMVTKADLLLVHTGTTLAEILLGFGLAIVAGFALALCIHSSRWVKRAVLPLVIASQTIPVFAIAPLLILWFGYGMGSKVVMAAIIVFFPIVVNTVQGLAAADPDILSLFVILEASPWQVLVKVRIPQALPHVFAGLKIGAAVSVIGAVIGEWVGSSQGLGYLMMHANAQLQVDLVFAAIVWLSVIGVGLYGFIAWMERLSLGRTYRRVSP